LLFGVVSGGGVGAVVAYDAQARLDEVEQQADALLDYRERTEPRLELCEAARDLGQAMRHVEDDNYGLAAASVEHARQRVQLVSDDPEIAAAFDEVALQAGQRDASLRSLVQAQGRVAGATLP
jgi:triphosphoribosyl-dephospho-CoA synthetase